MSRFGYAGEWVDETTGYSFLRARWLDVKTGSFLSEDPLVQMTQSAFDYTGGDPLTQIDPLGLYWGESFVNKAKDVGKKIGNAAKDAVKSTIEFASEHPEVVSFFFTVAAIGVSVTGVGAAAAPALIIAASTFSGLSSAKNFHEGNTGDGIIDLLGIIPGAASIKYGKKLIQQIDQSKILVQNGSLSFRRDVRGFLAPTKKSIKEWDQMANTLFVSTSVTGLKLVKSC